MVEYTAPPKDLNRLNPIQRYMQKGSLDKQDYVWLFIFVLLYFTVRPYLQELAKRFFSSETVEEGEQIRKDFIKSKAKVGPNAIRGLESHELETIPETKEETLASGSHTAAAGQVVNRKNKEKTGEEKLLDWDDEPERSQIDGDKTDVVSWLDKWDQEAES